MRHLIVLLSVCALAQVVFAEITLTRPAPDETVSLVHSYGRAVYKFEKREDRLAAIQKDKDGKGAWLNYKAWREPDAPVFEWEEDASCTNGVRLWFSTDPQFTPGRDTWFVPLRAGKTRFHARGTSGNFKVATRYYWKVAPTGAADSPVSTFVTADALPRWIGLGVAVDNIRDLGGWKTTDGRRVKQGLLYRGPGLNLNSPNQLDLGENRLMVTDVEFFKGRLGIKTDLDLRTEGEHPGMTVSPLGADVRLVQNSSGSYGSMYSDSGKKAMAVSFRTCANPANQPLYFHCIAGADRTGSVAFMLSGVLGVPEHDLLYDWECTFYPDLFKHDYYLRYPKLREPLDGYPGETLRDKIESYLISCGITKEEIEAFRQLMLEGRTPACPKTGGDADTQERVPPKS